MRQFYEEVFCAAVVITWSCSYAHPLEIVLSHLCGCALLVSSILHLSIAKTAGGGVYIGHRAAAEAATVHFFSSYILHNYFINKGDYVLFITHMCSKL